MDGYQCEALFHARYDARLNASLREYARRGVPVVQVCIHPDDAAGLAAPPRLWGVYDVHTNVLFKGTELECREYLSDPERTHWVEFDAIASQGHEEAWNDLRSDVWDSEAGMWRDPEGDLAIADPT